VLGSNNSAGESLDLGSSPNCPLVESFNGILLKRKEPSLSYFYDFKCFNK
jgi:hypothetical protein